MKLTDRQLKLRTAFRNAVIDGFKSDITQSRIIQTVIIAVDGKLQDYTGELSSEYLEVEKELQEIPSIGYINGGAVRYLCSNYAKISDALFNGLSKDAALKMFATVKRNNDRKSMVDSSNRYINNVANKKNRSHAELQNNMHGSRYAKTHWGIVK